MRAVEVVHAAPVGGFSFTPCCDRTVLELPPYDRISTDAAAVTCGRLSAEDERLLQGGPPVVRTQHSERLLYEMALSVRSLYGPQVSLEEAYDCVRTAVRELVPVREPEQVWPASLLVRITTRAAELAG